MYSFFWPLCCLSICELRLLITPLVSSKLFINLSVSKCPYAAFLSSNPLKASTLTITPPTPFGVRRRFIEICMYIVFGYINSKLHSVDFEQLWLIRTMILSNVICLNNIPTSFSYRQEVTCGLPDLGRSLTSFVRRCFLTLRLMFEWWWPTRREMCQHDMPTSVICNLPLSCIYVLI